MRRYQCRERNMSIQNGKNPYFQINKRSDRYFSREILNLERLIDHQSGLNI
ncbi:MAG: hypothetical protein U1C97_02465 [Candidatus Gracilibacteria bacterium]|nr:hypothetical protein [Candidatus Gracilibacteria bacterium]